eukprot:TRINITY_DN111275_c0_g1_i1.p1 TRINITY_DN111275_c0_g1~~TRINITY_DN111275_c0_g1_i1.p1  ORF type:complete len:447 (-),score=61.13 TRINITY_DN111275_c0_g1_i1:153-1493(-)
MGNQQPSQLVQEETARWSGAHSLVINPETRFTQIPKVANFGEQLYRVYEQRKDYDLEHLQYSITDRTNTITFEKSGVVVRNVPPENSFTDEKFMNNSDVAERLQQVCGGTAFSLALRNSEHLATYIMTGAWVSKQMLPNGKLGEAILKHFPADKKKYLDKLPREIRPDDWTMKEVYPKDQYSGFVRFKERVWGLCKDDEDAYNVIVLGPTGAGKSRIINILFNQEVSKSLPSIDPVTEEIMIFSGTAPMPVKVAGKWQDIQRKVNVIDTIGLCDSRIDHETLLALVKRHVKVNCSFIDKVVIVTKAPRLEGPHEKAILDILSWLKFSKATRKNFLFVYNQADQIDGGLDVKEQNLTKLLQRLGAAGDPVAVEPDTKLPSEKLEKGKQDSSLRDGGHAFALKTGIYTSFPSKETFESVRGDVHKLVDMTFLQMPERLRPDESWCSIL